MRPRERVPDVVQPCRGKQQSPAIARQAQAAGRAGRLLGEHGWTVATGGHDGAMAAVSRGAREAGAHVVGVTMPGPQGRSPNAWVAEERPADDLFARLRMLLDADAWIAVAGGVGTLAEIAVAWNLMQNAHVAVRPLIVVG
ncbi:MAG: LOG family protein, partial [Actinomycetota bacterium]